MLTRRSFFSSLVTAAAALTLDPERKLWVRGARLISIPRVPALRRHSSIAINAQIGISMRFTQRRDDEGRIVFQSFTPLPPGTRLTSSYVRIVA